MPEMEMPTALAVLIDAENIPATLFDALEREVRKLGEAVVWQLHGDLITWPHPGWQDVASSRGLEIKHQFHSGKNSADIAMTIAAMDLLHGGKLEGFCLVSSDRDFAPLARRLRADAVPVFGFGEPKTTMPFRNACTSFFELAAPAPKGAIERGLDALDIKRLHELLNAVCSERGVAGRVPTEVAASYIKAQAPELSKRVGGPGKFLRSLKALDLVNVHEEESKRLISARFGGLSVVKR
jgi:hypothetical protein